MALGFVEGSSAAGGFLERLERAERLEDLQAVSEALRDLYKVDHLIYHWVSASGEQYGCGTYDPVWVQRYIDKGYLRIDPVVQGCYQRFHPVDWKRLDWSSRAARAFQQDAIAHGVGNQGYSIPVRGPNGQFAMFTVSHNSDDDSWAAFTEANRRELILVAHYFNKKALELEPDRAPEPAQALSPREVEALALIQ